MLLDALVMTLLLEEPNGHHKEPFIVALLPPIAWYDTTVTAAIANAVAEYVMIFPRMEGRGRSSHCLKSHVFPQESYTTITIFG